jgi:hypothetical protein
MSSLMRAWMIIACRGRFVGLSIVQQPTAAAAPRGRARGGQPAPPQLQVGVAAAALACVPVCVGAYTQ